jgi:hypothetical protein
MQRRIFFVSALSLVTLAAAGGSHASRVGGGPRMGPKTTISRPAFHGYYDGHVDTYLNTDVSSKTAAKAMHINFAPVLRSVPLKPAPEIYLVEGKAAAGQLAVFGSEPGEASYSPIWKETILTWRANAKPVLIKSDTQVDALEKKGMLSERSTSVRLNCPIIKVGRT